MPELAQWPTEQASEVSWNDLPVKARLCEGWCTFRLKILSDWETTAARLGLPNIGMATSSAVAIGPGDWLIFCPEEQRENVLAKIALSQGYAVETSDALVMLDLGDAAEILSGLTGLNVESFGSGRATRTKLAGIGVILTTADDGSLRMIFDISYARHMRRFLEYAI